MTEQLQKKIDRAIRFLRSIPIKDGEKIELAYSGGKDSDVILQLAKEAGIPFWAIYKNTTIDPPGTISHVKKMLQIGGGYRAYRRNQTAKGDVLPSYRTGRVAKQILAILLRIPQGIQGAGQDNHRSTKA